MILKKKPKTQIEEEKNFFIEMLETFLTSFIVLMVIYWLVALPEVVLGASMEPTIYPGERILVEKVTKRFKDYQRGDIVVLHPPHDDDTDYVKRIVGIPGDIIKIYDCDVYVTRGTEKFVLEEPYLYDGTCTDTTVGNALKDGRSIKLQSGQYIVLGDNRPRSADSRYFGVLTKDRIVGKVVLRFWPITKLAFF